MFRLPVTCSYSEICNKVEEEWPIYRAAAYHLQYQGKPLLEVLLFRIWLAIRVAALALAVPPSGSCRLQGW